MNIKTLSLFALLTSLSLMGWGCNPFQNAEEKIAEKIAESAINKATGGNVDLDNQGKSINFKDNKTGSSVSFGEQVKIPSDFPKDIYLYSDAIPKSVVLSRNEGTTGLTLSSTDEPEKIVSWYEEKYKAEGFTIENSSTINQMEYRGFKKDNVSIIVSIWPNENEESKETMITMTRNEEKPE